MQQSLGFMFFDHGRRCDSETEKWFTEQRQRQIHKEGIIGVESANWVIRVKEFSDGDVKLNQNQM